MALTPGTRLGAYGGTSPRWSRNGRELIYKAGDQLMAVSYSVSRDAFVADKPRVWIAALGGAETGAGSWHRTASARWW